MRLLLLQDQMYVPSFGGGNKATRLLLEGLVDNGHACAVVAPALTSHEGPRCEEEFRAAMGARGVRVTSPAPGTRSRSFSAAGLGKGLRGTPARPHATHRQVGVSRSLRRRTAPGAGPAPARVGFSHAAGGRVRAAQRAPGTAAQPDRARHDPAVPRWSSATSPSQARSDRRQCVGGSALAARSLARRATCEGPGSSE